jgi:hypothetical protein
MTNLKILKYGLFWFFVCLSIISFWQSKVFFTSHKDTFKQIQVNLSTLIQNPKDYDGMWVETSGSILVLFEVFATSRRRRSPDLSPTVRIDYITKDNGLLDLVFLE